MSRKKTWRNALIASTVMLFTGTAAAGASLGLLDHVLAKSHAGKVVQTFPGPDGLTGIVLDSHGSKAIAYLTPDGRYLISGLVADLTTGANMTNNYGVKYIGKIDLVKGEAATKIAFQCASLSGVTVGPANAKNYMIAVFDPTTPEGHKIMAAMMGEAGQMAQKGALNVLALKLVPIGSEAPSFLSASNTGREELMNTMLANKPLPGATSIGVNLANRNDTVLSQIPMKPPFLVIYMPQAGMEAAIPIHNLMRVQSAVGAVETMAPQLGAHP